ncbi:MAG: hypothetical protein AB7K52_03565 [Phycisphaerales bacterium]
MHTMNPTDVFVACSNRLPLTPRGTLPYSVALVLLAGITGGLGGCASNSRPPTPDSITGKYIAVMCDADMTWSAFSSGMLGARASGVEDSLTVVGLPLATAPDAQSPRWETTVAQVGVSNSAMGPPVSLSVTRDGSRAYVCETRGPASAGAQTLADLPIGSALTAVDLSNPAQPAVLAKVDVGEEPTGCDVSPDGSVVAVVTRKAGQELVLVPVTPDAALGQPGSWPLIGVGPARPTCVQWRPGSTGRHLAVTVPDAGLVAFYEYTPDRGDGMPGLIQWGNPVQVGKYPASGRFTPDGRHFITTDLQWGPDVEGFMAGAPEGQLSVIRLADVDSAIASDQSVDQSRVVHEVVSRASVGVSPESMAISPDGRFVVTGNLRGSYLAEGAANATPGGSLSLLRLSGDELTPVSETPINSMPQGVAFDAGGRHLVVSEFRTFDPGALDGELAFYKLVTGGTPTLVPAKFYVGVGRGPHGVLIVR